MLLGGFGANYSEQKVYSYILKQMTSVTEHVLTMQKRERGREREREREKARETHTERRAVRGRERER